MGLILGRDLGLKEDGTGIFVGGIFLIDCFDNRFEGRGGGRRVRDIFMVFSSLVQLDQNRIDVSAAAMAKSIIIRKDKISVDLGRFKKPDNGFDSPCNWICQRKFLLSACYDRKYG